MEEIKILTDYVSAWAWQIIAIVMLVGISILIALIAPLGILVIAGVMVVAFGITQYLAIKRRKKVLNG